MFAMARHPDPRAKAIEDMLFQMGESARWLAERIGKRHSTVNQWLSGTKPHDPKVWDEMLKVLHDHDRGMSSSGNIRIRRTARLTLPVLPISQNVLEYFAMEQTGVYQNYVTIPNPDNGRRHWSRAVEDSRLFPLAEPGDILVLDDRPAESGHVVEVVHEGKTLLALLAGTKALPVLRFPNPVHTDVIEKDFAVIGVVWLRHRPRGGGITDKREYDFGMREDSAKK